MALSDISNYFETVSTVMNQTHFQVAMFAFNTVLLYDYYYNYSYVHGIICAAPGFQILEYQLVVVVSMSYFLLAQQKWFGENQTNPTDGAVSGPAIVFLSH